MSEEEKRKRASYRTRRKMLIRAQAIVIVAIVILAVILTAVYRQMDKTYYIDYTEQGEVDYKVYLKPNEFYDEEYLEAGQAYVASLIDYVSAEFDYTLITETSDVNYEYSYKVETQLNIKDKSSNEPLFSPVYEEKAEKTFSQNSSNRLRIKEKIDIDYKKYNDLANRFIATYELPDTSAELTVRMNVTVLSVCDDFEEDNTNEYVVALNIPLSSKTLDIEMTSSVPSAKNKILACERGLNKDFFMNGAIASAGAAAFLALCLVAFIYLTRNKDINYTIKVQRLVSAYKSYIQKINNLFDTDGYQVLMVNTFNEMLEIRDTIQSPILMNENEDQTCTRFIIPTNTKLLYTFEIKVEGYDELYGLTKDDEPVEEPKEDSLPEEVELAEETVEAVKVVEDVAETADTVVSEGEIDSVEEDGFRYGADYDYSFEAKLILSSEQTKSFYRQIVTFARSFGVKVVRSWKRERIYLGRRWFATLVFKGSKLAVAFALDPKEYEDTKYGAIDVSGVKKYEKTPMLMKITSARRAKYAVELLEKMFVDAELKNKGLAVDYIEIPVKSRRRLVIEELIRTNAPVEHISDEHPTPTPAVEAVRVEESTVTEEVDDGMESGEELTDAYRMGVSYDYSFEAKLCLSSDETKEYYRQIVTYARTFGVKVVRSWKRERIYLGRRWFATLVFKGSKLAVAFALDPKEYEDTKYRSIDVSGVKKYEKTPMLMKITSARRAKYATELLDKMFRESEITNKELTPEPIRIPRKTKKKLLAENLIRIENDGKKD